MITKSILAVAGGAALIVAAPATGKMTAAEFLTKATKLEKKGPLALFSKDMKLLKNEGETAGNQYRAMIKSQKRRGTKMHSCPPKKGSMDSSELLSHLRKMPAAQRQTTLFRDAFMSLMKKKYPC